MSSVKTQQELIDQFQGKDPNVHNQDLITTMFAKMLTGAGTIVIVDPTGNAGYTTLGEAIQNVGNGYGILVLGDTTETGDIAIEHQVIILGLTRKPTINMVGYELHVIQDIDLINVEISTTDLIIDNRDSVTLWSYAILRVAGNSSTLGSARINLIINPGGEYIGAYSSGENSVEIFHGKFSGALNITNGNGEVLAYGGKINVINTGLSNVIRCYNTDIGQINSGGTAIEAVIPFCTIGNALTDVTHHGMYFYRAGLVDVVVPPVYTDSNRPTSTSIPEGSFFVNIDDSWQLNIRDNANNWRLNGVIT